jgi:hypothetical protein
MFGVVLAAPTVADAALSQCTGSKMCVWGNNDFNWLIAAQDHGQGVIDVFNDANGENNQADSWANRSGTYNGCLYDGQGTGALLTMGKTSNDNNVSVFDSDKTSSMRTNRGC